MVTSLLIPETTRKSLEELSGELSYMEMPEFGNRRSVDYRHHVYDVMTSELRGIYPPIPFYIEMRNTSDPDIKLDSLRSDRSASSLGSTLGSSTLG